MLANKDTVGKSAPKLDDRFTSDVATKRLEAQFELAGSALIGGLTNVATITSAASEINAQPYLGIGAEDCTIRATTFSAPLTRGPGRGLAMPDEETVGESEQTVAWLMFDCAEGTRFGVFDWNQEIYRSCAPTGLATLSRCF